MLRVACQMDPLESLNLAGDSTYALMGEAARRGHALWHYTVGHLSLRDGRVSALAGKVTLGAPGEPPFTTAAPETLDLATMDVVLMRQDPPFDMGYISATHVLEHLQPGVLVVNDPAAVRNAPEKLLVAHYPRPDAAHADHLGPPSHPRFSRRIRRYHRQAALRQWRRRCLPHQARR